MLSAHAETCIFLSITNKNALERVARAATLLPRDHLLDATFSSIGSRLDPPRPPLSPTTRAPTLRLLGSGARRVAGGNDSRVALGGFERRRRGRRRLRRRRGLGGSNCRVSLTRLFSRTVVTAKPKRAEVLLHRTRLASRLHSPLAGGRSVGASAFPHFASQRGALPATFARSPRVRRAALKVLAAAQAQALAEIEARQNADQAELEAKAQAKADKNAAAAAERAAAAQAQAEADAAIAAAEADALSVPGSSTASDASAPPAAPSEVPVDLTANATEEDIAARTHRLGANVTSIGCAFGVWAPHVTSVTRDIHVPARHRAVLLRRRGVCQIRKRGETAVGVT